MIERLHDQRLIFVTGKGGVGKSTTTAALGKALAMAGRKTLILETDTYSAMEDLFEFKSRGLTTAKIDTNLWASNLLAEDCFIATLKRFLPSERLVRGIINNRVARVFFKAAPSVNEVTILDQVRVFLEEKEDGKPRYDHIIVDLPASGHAVTFLNVPATMNAMMRGIGPIAKMSGQIAEIIADEAQTAIIAVCLPEEMPVNETIELSANLKKALRRRLTLAIVNMVHHPPLSDEQRVIFDRLADTLREDVTEDKQDPAIFRLIEGNSLALGWHDRDQKYLAILHRELDEDVIEVPVFFESSGAEIVGRAAEFFLTHGDSPGQTLAS